MDKHLKDLLRLTLLFKLSAFLVILLAAFLFPFNSQNFLFNFKYPAAAQPDLWTHFKTWDAQHYLFLTDQGYAAGQQSNVFYPLWPLFIHLFSFLLLGNSLLAGLVLSVGLTLAAMTFLYLLVKELHGPKTAFNTCFFLLAFPTGFFLGLVYTESLFLALAVAYFYFARRNDHWAAALCAFLLPLTRPIGVLILPAACLVLIFRKKKNPLPWQSLLGPFSFLLGFWSYLSLMKAFTGNYWTGFDTQGRFLSHNDLSNLIHPIDWFMNNFIHIHYSLLGVENDPLNRLFFLAFVLALILSYRLLDKSLWVYALVLGLFPAMISDLMSYMRYLVVVFPLFIYLALKWGPYRRYYLLVSVPVQIIFLILHSLNVWVA